MMLCCTASQLVLQAFYVESISNPLLEVGDLRAVAAFSKQHQLTSIIDSTFAPPVNFRPASIGFSVVLHSATKYANGHSDIVGGIAAGSSSFISQVRMFFPVPAHNQSLRSWA